MATAQGTLDPLPLFGIGTLQRSPFLSTVERVNCVAEILDNGRQQAALIGLPGLVAALRFGSLPARGIFVQDSTDTFYLASGNQVLIAEPNQPLRTLVTLTTDSGPVWMDSNGTQLFINDGVTPYVYTYASGASALVTDADYPTGARGGVFLAGRFWVYVPNTSSANAGRVYSSDQYNGLSWDGLNFFTPAARPDGVVGLFRWSNNLVVFGNSTIEWWAQGPVTTQGALGFQPAANANAEVGANAERGWASVNQRLFFLGHSGGESGVYEVQGYQTEMVSTPAINTLLADLPNLSLAVCAGYMAGGHTLFQVTIPGDTRAGAKTLLYDATTGLWSIRTSEGRPYYRGLLAAHTEQATYLTDAFTGVLYRMDADTYTEDGAAMEFAVGSTHLLSNGDAMVLHNIQIDCDVGHGTESGAGVDPHGVLEVSKDGGRTWVIRRFVPLGKQGEYTRRASCKRLGRARDFAVRFRITDPIPRRVTGAYLNMDPGTA